AHLLCTLPVPVRLLVVDEVHMVQEWGETFRCSFQTLGALRQRLLESHPGMRTLLLSATLTHGNREGSLVALRVEPSKLGTVTQPALRKELRYRVVRITTREQRWQKLLEELERLPRPGIIYCRTREACHEVADFLRIHG